MRKSFNLISLVGVGVVLSACGNVNEENDEGILNSEKSSESAEVSDEGTTDANDSSDDEAVEILEHAIETHEQVISYYEHIVHYGDGDDEVSNENKVWHFKHNDGTRSHRSERENIYEVIKQDDTAQSYIENENTLYEFQDEVGGRADAQSTMVQLLTSILEHGEVSYEGEETVHDYDTYVISFDDGEVEGKMWFDQETYYRVKEDGLTDEIDSQSVIVDYDLNLDFDEELFHLDNVVPDDVEIVEERPSSE